MQTEKPLVKALAVPRLWTRDEYYRMAEVGILGPEEKTELIAGEIIDKVSPQRRPHTVAVYRTAHALEEVFGTEAYVQTQAPLTLDNGSEPEPDILVVAGSIDQYLEAHPGPSSVLLLVEVSDSTLAFDRSRKAQLYADAGIWEYWIVNLVDRCLEVFRDPATGSGYATIFRHAPTDTVTSLAKPNAPVRVGALLP